jgi:cyclopropane fatty-acyl-phospholipid synthase-like methyltransferase
MSATVGLEAPGRRAARDLLEPSAERPAADLVAYYTEAGPDFGAWSPGFNMHFGFWRPGTLRLEAMLEQMNAEVWRRLGLAGAARVVDLGCGLGATARAISRRAPGATVTGVTLVPWQAAQARLLTRAAGLEARVRFLQADYRDLPCPDASFDGAYAIESACHAGGAGKGDFLREAARVLRPGGRLVVADAFLKHGPPRQALLRRCYDTVRRFWCVDAFGEIEAFRAEAERAGFEDVRVEDVSWRVAPSVLFVPAVVARFLWRELVVKRSRLTPRRWGNALAPLLGMGLGAARSAFGYYLVTARQPQRPERGDSLPTRGRGFKGVRPQHPLAH